MFFLFAWLPVQQGIFLFFVLTQFFIEAIAFLFNIIPPSTKFLSTSAYYQHFGK